MTKSNRIIVLVDLSENTENLLAFSFKLSDAIHGKLIFVHHVMVVSPALSDLESKKKFADAAVNEATVKLQHLVENRIAKKDAMVVSTKPVSDILKDLQSELYNDWVLGGIKQDNFIKRLFFGSTITDIVSYTNIITVAVTVTQQANIPHKLMVATTAKRALNKDKLEVVLDALSNTLNQVVFFTVIENEDDENTELLYLESLKEAFSKYKVSTLVVKSKNTVEVIKNQIESHSANFLVVQEDYRDESEDLFKSSQINDFIHDGSVSLIILPT